MKIGLGHIGGIMIPITAFMSLVLYHSSKPEHQLFNAIGFPFFMIGFFVYMYFLLKYCADEDTNTKQNKRRINELSERE